MAGLRRRRSSVALSATLLLGRASATVSSSRQLDDVSALKYDAWGYDEDLVEKGKDSWPSRPRGLRRVVTDPEFCYEGQYFNESQSLCINCAGSSAYRRRAKNACTGICPGTDTYNDGLGDKCHTCLGAVRRRRAEVCDECLVGKYYKEGQCLTCVGGAVSSRRRASDCHLFCPGGTFNDGSNDDCLTCVGRVRRRRATSCTPCPVTAPHDVDADECSPEAPSNRTNVSRVREAPASAERAFAVDVTVTVALLNFAALNATAIRELVARNVSCPLRWTVVHEIRYYQIWTMTADPQVMMASSDQTLIKAVEGEYFKQELGTTILERPRPDTMRFEVLIPEAFANDATMPTNEKLENTIAISLSSYAAVPRYFVYEATVSREHKVDVVVRMSAPLAALKGSLVLQAGADVVNLRGKLEQPETLVALKTVLRKAMRNTVKIDWVSLSVNSSTFATNSTENDTCTLLYHIEVPFAEIFNARYAEVTTASMLAIITESPASAWTVTAREHFATKEDNDVLMELSTIVFFDSVEHEALPAVELYADPELVRLALNRSGFDVLGATAATERLLSTTTTTTTTTTSTSKISTSTRASTTQPISYYGNGMPLEFEGSTTDLPDGWYFVDNRSVSGSVRYTVGSCFVLFSAALHWTVCAL